MGNFVLCLDIIVIIVIICLFEVFTVIFSMIIWYIGQFRLYKYAADIGYKINLIVYEEFNTKNTNEIIFLTPIFNIINVTQNILNRQDGIILDQLRVIGALEEMTELEKEIYSKKPTGFSAFFIDIKVDSILFHSNCLKYKLKNNHEGKIYYEFLDDDIRILKSCGCAKCVTIENQKEAVKYALLKTEPQIIENYGSLEEFKKHRGIVINAK